MWFCLLHCKKNFGIFTKKKWQQKYCPRVKIFTNQNSNNTKQRVKDKSARELFPRHYHLPGGHWEEKSLYMRTDEINNIIKVQRNQLRHSTYAEDLYYQQWARTQFGEERPGFFFFSTNIVTEKKEGAKKEKTQRKPL